MYSAGGLDGVAELVDLFGGRGMVAVGDGGIVPESVAGVLFGAAGEGGGRGGG